MSRFKVVKIQEYQNRLFATDENGYVWIRHPGKDFVLFEVESKPINDKTMFKHMLGEDDV